MSKVALEGDVSVGETPFPSTAAIGPYTTKTKINGKYVQLKDVTQYAEHSHDYGGGNIVTHPSITRIVTTGSSTMKIEGYYVARIGDSLGDGDTIKDSGLSNLEVG